MPSISAPLHVGQSLALRQAYNFPNQPWHKWWDTIADLECNDYGWMIKARCQEQVELRFPTRRACHCMSLHEHV